MSSSFQYVSNRLSRVTVGLIILSACAACTQPVNIEGSGYIAGAKSGYECFSYQDTDDCSRLIDDFNNEGFQEMYVAVAARDWVFVGWGNCPDAEGISGQSGNMCSFDVSSAYLRASAGMTVPALKATFEFVGHEGSPFPDEVSGLSGEVWSLTEHASGCYPTYVEDRPEANLYEQSVIEVLESTIKIHIKQYRDEGCRIPYEQESVIANQVNFEVLDRVSGVEGFDGVEAYASERFIVRIDGWLHSADYYAGLLKDRRVIALAHGYLGAAISFTSWADDSYVMATDLSQADFDWSRSYFKTDSGGCPTSGIGADFCG